MIERRLRTESQLQYRIVEGICGHILGQVQTKQIRMTFNRGKQILGFSEKRLRPEFFVLLDIEEILEANTLERGPCTMIRLSSQNPQEPKLLLTKIQSLDEEPQPEKMIWIPPHP